MQISASTANLMGNRLTVPTSVNQGLSLVNVKCEPTDHDPTSPASRSSHSPTSPYARRMPISREDQEIEKDVAHKRQRLDPVTTAANGWR